MSFKYHKKMMSFKAGWPNPNIKTRKLKIKAEWFSNAMAMASDEEGEEEAAKEREKWKKKGRPN